MASNRRNFLRSLSAGTVGLLGGARSKGIAALLQLPPPLRYPYLQNLRGDRVTILWTTVENRYAVVQYSTDRSFSTSVEADVQEYLAPYTGLNFRFYQYRAELGGLSPGTDYSYRVILDDRNLTPLDELHFRTPGPGPFRFLVFGDSGEDTAGQSSVARRMIEEDPALVLHTGDLVYPSCTFDQIDRNYFRYYRDLMRLVPFFPTPGNHEYESNNAATYLAVHAVPVDDVPVRGRGRYYSFDWGNVHFISLDSNASLVEAANGTGQMLQWLESDLQKTRQLWRVVYFHHPPYSTGLNQNDPLSALVRDRVVPILERYNVQLVINGHEHSYQRSKPIKGGVPVDSGAGTVYLTSGGGGASLYPTYSSPLNTVRWSAHHYLRADVEQTRITLRAIRDDGVEIDAVTLGASPSHSRRRP
jgi:hypothetical protein